MSQKFVILTEEKPSIWEISTILTELGINKKAKNIIIQSTTDYNVYKIKDIDNILLFIVQGEGSFIDYLVYKINSFRNIKQKITELSVKAPYIALESTKTRPHDSGNSGPYQRIGKFTTLYKMYKDNYKNINKILFYDNDLSQENNSFRRGVQICRSIGIKVVNKYNKLPKYYKDAKPFKTIQDLINEFSGNIIEEGDKIQKIPLRIREKNNVLEIQAKLAKPNNTYKKQSGGLPPIKTVKYMLNNDPNIGFTTSISFFVRLFSDKKNIKIRFINHCLFQYSIDTSSNKWFQNMNMLKNYELKGLTLSDKNKKDKNKSYFSICSASKEKMASILLDVLLREKYEKNRYRVIFSNHAGTEKTDIKSIDGKYSIPTIKQRDHLYPDLVMVDTKNMILHIIEGKIWKKRETQAIPELHKMDKFIEHTKKFINKHSDKKIKKVIRSLSLMAPNVSYETVMKWSSEADFHVMHSINKDLNNTIHFYKDSK
jgi:hypothetical protein